MKAYQWFFVLLATVACGKLTAQTTPPSVINTSAMVDLAPGRTATVGFVVAAQNGQPSPTVLIRAIGPSLSVFGIKSPAALPHLRLFNAKGQDVTPTVFLFPVDWNATFALAGAFKLTGGERAIDSYDVAGISAGNYTVQVTDDSGNGGTVLIEVYLIANAVYIPGPS